jgi:outer membrane receptor protein involved in Fe transport
LDVTPQWSWYLAAIYVGDRYPGSDYANDQAKLNPTTVVNTNVAYHINHWRMALQCNNLSNAQYLESAYLSGGEVGYYPAPERNFLLSTTYEF